MPLNTHTDICKTYLCYFDPRVSLRVQATPRWNFVVPKEGETDAEKWPAGTHGMQLGALSSDIRKGKSYRPHRAEFESLGMQYYTTAIKKVGKRGRKGA